MSKPNITIPVDLTNPGQYFACCGLLELADRLWPGTEGWFEGDLFHIAEPRASFATIIQMLRQCIVSNTMTKAEWNRLNELTALKKKERTESLENEKKLLEALRRECPILLTGPISLVVDWFCDELAGGSRFKTWAGMQSVLDITQAMHAGLSSKLELSESTLWNNVRGIGLPFNFDSDLGGQGSALDIGFSFDPLAASETTRIEVSCKPTLELLSFVGLQRFRPLEVKGENRFIYTAWKSALTPSVAAPVVCSAIDLSATVRYEFRLLYRTKYLKSFLPAQPSQGDRYE